jgi:hypothetical protein
LGGKEFKKGVKMANLDKLLRKIEKNYENNEQTETNEYTIGGETYEVRTMTRKEKSELMYSIKAQEGGYKIGDLIKLMIKPIYNCFNLKELAVKAKDTGYIKSYYDVVEMLFEPMELMEITSYLFDTNGINTDKVALEELEDIKK